MLGKRHEWDVGEEQEWDVGEEARMGEGALHGIDGKHLRARDDVNSSCRLPAAHVRTIIRSHNNSPW
jgi:hypothetical protein